MEEDYSSFGTPAGMAATLDEARIAIAKGDFFNFDGVDTSSKDPRLQADAVRFIPTCANPACAPKPYRDTVSNLANIVAVVMLALVLLFAWILAYVS